ncbi:MAG: hypothetical protein KY476_05030 [Planctomycetes bacterium]|nr:hypothetical protein [Planctomycetota bacterium]
MSEARALTRHRRHAWRLAAITGTIGIILLLFVQLSGHVTRPASADLVRRNTRSTSSSPRPASLVSDSAEPVSEAATAPLLEPVPEGTLRDRPHLPDAPPESHSILEPLPTWSAAPAELPPEAESPAFALRTPELQLEVAQYLDVADQYLVEGAADAPVAIPAAFLEPGPWQPGGDERHTREAPLPYAAQLSPEERRTLEAEWHSDRVPEAAESIAVLDLSIERRWPQTPLVHRPWSYEIVVRNQGHMTVPMIAVEEASAAAETVLDVSPRALPDEGRLRWLLRDLDPGTSTTLHVESVTTEGGEQEKTALVRATAAVASRTEIVAPEPPLRLRRIGIREPLLGERVRFTNEITNTSDEPLRDVTIVEQVPEGYEILEVADAGRYDRSRREIEWQIPELPAGETALLSVVLAAAEVETLVTVVTARPSDGFEQTMRSTIRPRRATERPRNTPRCCLP